MARLRRVVSCEQCVNRLAAGASGLAVHGLSAPFVSILADAGAFGVLRVVLGRSDPFCTAAARSLRILQRTSASPAASTGSRLMASRRAFFSQSDAAGPSVTLRAF